MKKENLLVLKNYNSKILASLKRPHPWILAASQTKFFGTWLVRSRVYRVAVLNVVIVDTLASRNDKPL